MKNDNLLDATIKILTENINRVGKPNKKVEVKKVDKSNGIPDEMYEIADNILKTIKTKDFLSKEDFDDLLFKMLKKY